MAKKILRNKLDWLTEKKDFEKYRIKDDIFSIFPTKKHPELRERIIEWIYRDVFKDWVRAPEPVMRTKLDTLIKNYGPGRIQELYLESAELTANPHPSKFFQAIRKLQGEEEPITEKLTATEVKKLRKKHGY